MSGRHSMNVSWHRNLSRLVRVCLLLILILNGVLPTCATAKRNGPAVVGNLAVNQPYSNVDQPPTSSTNVLTLVDAYSTSAAQALGDLQQEGSELDECYSLPGDDISETIDALSPAVYLLDLLDFVKDSFGEDDLETTEPTSTENLFDPPDLGSNEYINKRFKQRFEDVVVSEAVEQQRSYVQFTNEILENLIVELDAANPKDENLLLSDDPWLSYTSDETRSLAWGDMDGDGDLDLAVADSDNGPRVYRQQRGGLTTGHVWASAESYNATSVAWGDVDGDGDLDLAVGSDGSGTRVYRNDGERLQSEDPWISHVGYDTASIAWGDMDGDGYPELAQGNLDLGTTIFLNQAGTLETIPSLSLQYDKTMSVAWGDMDGDGYLDLAVGNDGSYSKVYLNEGGSLDTTPSFTLTVGLNTKSVAWGDVDGDGYLDLATGDDNSGTGALLYRNDAGVLRTRPSWNAHDVDNNPTSVAWGDVDGDGDLDLAVGIAGYGINVYRNDEGELPTEATWASTDGDEVTDIAWGDMDGDGDLDLAVGTAEGYKNKIYRNGIAETYARESGFAPDVWEDLFDSYLRELETTRDEVQLLLKVRSNVTASFTSNFLAEHDLEESDLEFIGELEGEKITAADVTELRDDILKRAITKQIEREYGAETILCLSERLRDEFELYLKTAKRKVSEELFLALVELSAEENKPADDEQALQQKWYEARACIAGMEEICPDLPDKLKQKVPVNPLTELKVFSQDYLTSGDYQHFILVVQESIQQMETEGKFDEKKAQIEAEILLLTLAKLVFEVKQRDDPAYQGELEKDIAARAEEQWQATKINVETGYHSKIRTNLIIIALSKMKNGSNRPFEIEEVTGDNHIVNTQENIDRLADYLFLDLLVDESHLTTPVAFAVSRIQTFIQSTRLGTVPNYRATDFDESKWSWLKSYGSWHARQVVSHYPENFLIPEIRETISPSFEQVIKRLNEGADVETVAAEYLGEINDFINIRYYTSLVINSQLFIFARNDAGKFFYSVVKEDGSWIGWRTVPANVYYFPAKPVKDVQLVYTPGYLNLLRLGANEEGEIHLYHIPIKLVGSRLKIVGDPNESQENGESWQRTDVPINSICYYGREKLFCEVKEWNILKHGELKDLYGLPLGQGFIIYKVVDHEKVPQSIYRSYFKINSGRVEAWEWSSIEELRDWQKDWNNQLPYVFNSRWRDIAQLKPIQNGRGMLWLMREEIQGEASKSLYFSPNSLTPPYPDSPDHILITEDFTGQHFGFFSTSLGEDRIFYEENGELVVVRPGGDKTERFRLSDELRSNADLETPITGAYIGNELYIVGGLSYEPWPAQKWMSFYTNIRTEHQTNIGIPLIDDHPQLQDDQSTAEAFFAETKNDGGAYDYVEEYYFHLPTLIAEFLNQNQQYAEAFEWLRKIYEPLDPLGSEARLYPPLLPTNMKTCSYSEMQTWMDDELDPYAVASNCGNVYLSSVKMQHIRNLLDWADYLFVQDTNESVNRARELYELAAGIHKTLESPDETPVDGAHGFPIPQNSMIKIVQWRIESNLTKIRTNRNFAGIQRTLQPYVTPLDPTRYLERVTSGGGIYERSIPSSPPSVYRYAFLLERAKYLASVAQQFENSMLSSIEKEEEATYSYMRARQDVQLERGNVTLQSLRLREAEDARRQALEQRARANTQWSHYDDLINEGLNTYEKLALVAMHAAAGSLHGKALMVQIATFGLGGWGEVGQALSASASVFMTHASFERRKEEWEFQRDLAKHDITIADIGVALADDRIDIVDKEWEIANMRLGFANDVVEYMENERFTNPQLYRWMNRNLEDLYRDQLNMAISTAKAAQQALEFERQTSLDFIGYDYWDDEKRGLLGVEQLLADMEKMEQFRLTNTSRKREIEKTISLSSVAPAEFQQFLETGVLDFATPAEWFDRDFPGHYMRLIRDVRVAVVALVPPSEGIHATLFNSGISRVMTGEPFEEPTVLYRLPPEAIAISSPYNSSGLFELNPQDPMLLPFEGSGVATDWRLEMPKGANRFDYDTIFDVLVTIRYTAMEDTSYRQKVLTDMGQDGYGYVPIDALRSFSLRNEFPDQWYHFHNPVSQHDGEYADPYADPSVLSSSDARPLKPYTMVIDLTENDFLDNEEDCTVRRVTLSIQPSDELAGEERKVEFKLKFIPELGSVFTDTIILSSERPYGSTESIDQSPFGQWILQVGSEQGDTSWLEDILFIVEYEAKVHYIR